MKLDASAFVGDQELIDALKHRATPVDCSSDRVLFCQGDEPVGLYILHSGKATMTMRTIDDDIAMNMAVEPGSLLGLPAVVSNSNYSLSATAKAGAEVSFVPRDAFSKMMLSEPGLAVLILKVLAAEVRTARIAACKG